MDIHNYPIDYAVTVTDERVRRLLRERDVRRGRDVPEPLQRARTQQRGWRLRLVLAEPLIVGGAGFLLGWLVSQRA